MKAVTAEKSKKRKPEATEEVTAEKDKNMPQVTVSTGDNEWTLVVDHKKQRRLLKVRHTFTTRMLHVSMLQRDIACYNVP